jgi:hypothetical protein
MTPLSSYFEDEAWLCRLAYRTDIFSKLSDLNLNLQGNGNYIFSMEDKVRPFYRKLLVWQGRVKSGNLAAFTTMLDFLDENYRNEPPAGTQSHITQHFENLSQQFLSYYSYLTEDSGGGNEWIFSQFTMDAVSKSKIMDNLQDNIIDMTTDHRFQTICKEKYLSKFWCECQQGLSIPWTKCSDGFATIWINNILARKNFFCHDINQDQAEKLPADGTRLYPRCQHHPAYNRQVDVFKTSLGLPLTQKRFENLQSIGLGCVDWIRLSQDRDRWRAVVNAVMNLRVLAPRS